jgi:hypothetical protein
MARPRKGRRKTPTAKFVPAAVPSQRDRKSQIDFKRREDTRTTRGNHLIALERRRNGLAPDTAALSFPQFGASGWGRWGLGAVLLGGESPQIHNAKQPRLNARLNESEAVLINKSNRGDSWCESAVLNICTIAAISFSIPRELGHQIVCRVNRA